jgi:hypothetical protein
MNETDITEEEKKLIKQINDSQNYGGTGNLIGSGIGTGVGLALAAGTGGAALPFVPLIAGAGNAIGGLIGTSMGQSSGEAAQEKLQKLQEARMRPFLEKQARQEALNKLVGRYNTYGI